MAGSQCSFFVITSIVYAVTLLALVSEVDATATLVLHMERYDNPSSLDAAGDNCDSANNPCDHIFRFALDRGNSDDNPRGRHYWVHVTRHFQDQHTIEFGKDMAGVPNPIVTPFNTWPPIGVKFKVFVTDDDSGWFNPDDDVDSFVQLLRLTPAVNISVANWTSVHMLGRRGRHRSTLTMKYKLYCDANYYSPDCSVKCVANETYTCDPATGRIICRPGWEDVSTMCTRLSDDCRNNTCRNGATCIDGVRSHTCRCLPGYTGATCEAKLSKCTTNPCEHGGTCDDQENGFICHCPPGFTGKLCADDHRSMNDVVNRTVLPRHVISEESDNEGNSTPAWVYVLIVAALLIVLAILALIAFLYTRRRKRASDSERQPPMPCSSLSASSQSPSSQSQPPSYSRASATEAAQPQDVQWVTNGAVGAVGFCGATDNVDMLTGNKLNQERLEADECGEASCSSTGNNNSSSNIYDDVAPARIYELEKNTDASDGTETHL